MKQNIIILLTAAVVIALPFVLRRSAEQTEWRPGDPELVIITPNNEAVRFEFGLGFSRWHQEKYGKPVRVDWRNLGGSSEISRYLTASYTAAVRAWWTAQGKEWPLGAGEALADKRYAADVPPTVARLDGESDADFSARSERETARWNILHELYQQFRAVDDPDQFSSRIDLLMGGGEFDHQKAISEGLLVQPWPPDYPPEGLFTDADGRVMIPPSMGGENWRTDTFFGNAISTFGICFNFDRLHDLGIEQPPERWEDLADPRYAHFLGAADPTKSGSIAKSFELLIHQQCYNAIRAAGFSDEEIARFEKAISDAKLPRGEIPGSVPAVYQQALEDGWLIGMKLVQRIGANARYFTDSASKVPIDVSMGAAAAGIAIDFYARFQAQSSLDENGKERMSFITPVGGSGVSCDPVSLLRGAPNREIAVRFIEFTLRDEGQKLWTYRPGTPGGPIKYALRRTPIRRTFFPSDDPTIQAQHEIHQKYSSDNLADPHNNPYEVGKHFTYHPRWTAALFSVHSDIIRAMCLNSSEELTRAWNAILRNGGPEQQPEAMAIFEQLPKNPEPVTWRSAPVISKTVGRLDYMRDWTTFYRANYARALNAVIRGGTAP